MTDVRRTTSRRTTALLLTVILVATGCAAVATAGPQAGLAAADEDTAFAQQLCENLPQRWLQRMANAFRDDFSGDVQYLPRYPNPVDGGLSHAGPWDHLQEVPLLVWGPGFVKPGVYPKDASLTDIAPTSAALVKFPYQAPDGRALTEGLLPAGERKMPKLVVTLVWDSSGINVLQEWPDDWPFLRSMIEDGAWFPHATVGISNSNTPPGHAAIGTGAFPTTSGFVDEYLRIGDALPHPGDGGPSLLLWPTFADLYDLANGNRPVVGAVATLASHTMMMSHGAMWNGGDRDISVVRQAIDAETSGVEAVEWNLPGEARLYYKFPLYANEVSAIDEFNRELDQRDGQLDGNWRTHSIEQLRNGFDTPARTPYQSQLVEAVVEREGFGADATPDLLFLNYKAIDTIGHSFGMSSPEMQDTVRYQDEALEQIVTFLNEQVGEGEWALVLTADHGSQYPWEVSGGIPIDPPKMKALVNERFDSDDDGVAAFQQIRPTQLWADLDELEQNGFTTDDVANYIAGLTAAQVARTDYPLSDAQADDLVYETAFPSRVMDQLDCVTETGEGT